MSKFSIPKLNVTQASVTSLFIYIVGQAVTFVPGLSPEKTQLISVGTLVIASVFGLIHVIHAVVDLVAQYIAGNQKVTLSDLEGGVRNLAKDEIGKINITSEVENLLAGKKLPSLTDIEQAIDKKISDALDNVHLVKLVPGGAEAAAPAPAVDPAAPTFGAPVTV